MAALAVAGRPLTSTVPGAAPLAAGADGVAAIRSAGLTTTDPGRARFLLPLRRCCCADSDVSCAAGPGFGLRGKPSAVWSPPAESSAMPRCSEPAALLPLPLPTQGNRKA